MLIRCAVMAAAVLVGSGDPLHAQQGRVWSAELVGLVYETGDTLNCGSGAGIGIDIERRIGSPYVAIVGGLRLASPFICHSAAEVRLVDGRYLDVARQLSLLGAPLLGVVAGPDAATFPLPLAPRLRVAVLSGNIDAPKDERHLMPLGQAELHARYRRLAILVRTSAIRAPVLLQSSDSGQWDTVAREWEWRRLHEVGVRLHW